MEYLRHGRRGRLWRCCERYTLMTREIH
jgi:hypothetical protein